MKCSVDGGVPEICSFPLEVTAGTYGLDPHILEVTAFDVFGLNMTLPLHFQLGDREFFTNCYMSLMRNRAFYFAQFTSFHYNLNIFFLGCVVIISKGTKFRLCPVNGGSFDCVPDFDGDCLSDSQVKISIPTLHCVFGWLYCKHINIISHLHLCNIMLINQLSFKVMACPSLQSVSKGFKNITAVFPTQSLLKSFVLLFHRIIADIEPIQTSWTQILTFLEMSVTTVKRSETLTRQTVMAMESVMLVIVIMMTMG